MAAQWPAVFQDFLNEESFSYQYGETAVKSENDIGPAKRRQRFTRAIRQLRVQIQIEVNQVATLESFFYDTLAGGTLAFEFNDPFDQTLKEYKMDAPQISPMGGRYFQVNMNWEEQL